jgi:hypothetical protein
MRMARNWALGFAVANLVLGFLALFAPAVKSNRMGDRIGQKIGDKLPNLISDKLPGQKMSLINRRSGTLLGFLGAVNPPHGILHLALGSLGLGTRLRRGTSRPYLGLLALLYGAMAFMGWREVGFKPGIHHVMGFAVDRVDNIIHTILGASALAAAVVGRPASMNEASNTSSQWSSGQAGFTPRKSSIKKVGVGG